MYSEWLQSRYTRDCVGDEAPYYEKKKRFLVPDVTKIYELIDGQFEAFNLVIKFNPNCSRIHMWSGPNDFRSIFLSACGSRGNSRKVRIHTRNVNGTRNWKSVLRCRPTDRFVSDPHRSLSIEIDFFFINTVIFPLNLFEMLECLVCIPTKEALNLLRNLLILRVREWRLPAYRCLPYITDAESSATVVLWRCAVLNNTRVKSGSTASREQGGWPSLCSNCWH